MDTCHPVTCGSIVLIGLVFAIFFHSGCAHGPAGKGRIIQQGEPVTVTYTCHLPDGRMVTTNDEIEARSPEAQESRIFWPPRKFEPLTVIAGNPRQKADDPAKDLPSMQLQSLREVIEAKLPETMVGKRSGKAYKITLNTEPQETVPESERMVTLIRAQQLPKKLRISIHEYMSRTGALSPPAVDQKVGLYPGLEGRIVAMTENEVQIEFKPRYKASFPGPFGKRRIVEKNDHYLLQTDVEKGQLIRTGPHMGRVSEVEGGMFLVDYSHAFGGKALECDVIADANPQQAPSAGKVLVENGKNEPSASNQDFNDNKPAKSIAGVAAAPSLKAQNPEKVQAGDLAEVHYTARLPSGKLIYTTLEEVAKDKDTDKLVGYRLPSSYQPLLVIAGKPASVPGLGEMVVGLHPNETKHFILPPEKAFGPRNPKLIKKYPSVRRFPQTTTLKADKWHQKFNSFPRKGSTYSYNYYLDATVKDVGSENVTFWLSPKKLVFEDEIGTTTVTVKNETIEIKLIPEIGATYTTEGKSGIVSTADGSFFTVDFNSPVAGRNIHIDIEVLSLTKASEFSDIDIKWIGDHEKGLLTAEQQGKPMVMVLYADWCSWSKKLLDDSLQDPRVEMFHDDFVWVKINSHKDQSIKALYEQKGFPLILLLSPDGDTVSRIDGFKDAGSLNVELRKALQNIQTDSENIADNKVQSKI